MARPKKVDFYVVREGGAVTMPDGDVVTLAVGDLVRAGHPIMKNRGDLFEPFASKHVRFDMEEATDNPGESRGEEE